MYRDFRERFPELTRAADARHIEAWDSIDDGTPYIWFESLAGAINDRMGDEEFDAELAPVFGYFDAKLRGGDSEVKTCIDVSFVENLFWRVAQRNSARVWPKVPKSLQTLYVGFHGRPPTKT